jgi:hypothetical protein
MSSLTSFPARAAVCLRAALVAFMIVPVASGAEEPSDRAPAARPARPPVRVYTNADLERVHPFAAETGVRSVPAVEPGERQPRRERSEPAARGRGEAYWRQQATAVRERVRALEERAAGLRARIAERERERASTVYGSRRRGSAGGSPDALRASLAALERRIRATQDDLEERARRDGALPGWLR